MVRRVWVLIALFALVACSGGGPAPSSEPDAFTLSEQYEVAAPFPRVVEAAPNRRTLDRAASTLAGPHFAFSLAAVASVTGVLPDEMAERLHLPDGATVPAGHQLLVAEITGPATGEGKSGNVGDVTIAVAYGTQSRPVRGGASALYNGVLAIVLPADARPVLKVTDAGRTQSLDLTAGRRGADAIAGYYPAPRGEWKSGGPTTALRLYGAAVAALSAQERLATVGLKDLPVELVPYADGRGWAKPGRAWAVVGAEVAYSRQVDRDDADRVAVPASCFAATGPGGLRIALTGDPLRIGERSTTSSVPSDSGYSTLTADVPASLRQLTVTFRFCGTITTKAGPATYETLSDPALTAAITLT